MKKSGTDEVICNVTFVTHTETKYSNNDIKEQSCGNKQMCCSSHPL